MSSKPSASARTLCVALLLAATAGSSACRNHHLPQPTGEIRLSLTGSAGGVTYRLRNARFVITELSNGAQTTLDSETDPNGTVLTTALAVGVYSVNLENGWALERTDTGQVVDATLTSPNPRMFQILAGSTTTLTYELSTSGGPVTVGTGTLNIGIKVTVTDGGAPDGGGGGGGCTTTPDSCGTGFVCQQFDDGSGTGGTVGMCVHACNPVTQQRSDGVAACGSANPSNPNLGCYGTNGVFTCAPVPSAAAGLTHGMPAFGPVTGGAFLNGCAAGYTPRFPADTVMQTIVCVAYCQPATTFQGNGSSSVGVPPYTCPARGATMAECRFLSWVDTGPTAVDNAFGVCFDYQNFNYDHDMNASTPNILFPSCTAVSSSDLDGNGTPDYLDWGCGPRP